MRPLPTIHTSHYLWKIALIWCYFQNICVCYFWGHWAQSRPHGQGKRFRGWKNQSKCKKIKKVDDPLSIVIHILVTIRRGFDFSRTWNSKLWQEFRSEKQVRPPDISYKVFYVASKYKCWFSFVLITAVVVVCIAVVVLHTRSCGEYRAVGRGNAGLEG